MNSFFVRPLIECAFQLQCNFSNLDTTQDIYKFSAKMSNGNGLQGRIGSESMFTVGQG